MVERPAQPARRDRRDASTSPRRRASSYALDDERRHDRRAPARLAPEREAPARRRRSRASGGLVDFGLYFFHCAAAADRAAASARTSTCPRWRATSRRGSGTTCSSRPGARSASRRARSARPCSSRPIPAAFEMEEILYELRDHSAGLNAGRWDYMFSIIKNFRSRGARLHAARPQRGDHDGAVHARLHRAAGAHLPQARRARDRRHGGVHPEQGRGGQRGRLREGPATTRPARPATGSTARGWRTRAWFRCAARCSTPCSVTGRTSVTGCATRCRVSAERAARRALDTRGRDRGRPARQRQRRRAVHRDLAARPGCRRHQQPDGGRGHRRDLPLARCGSGCTTTYELADGRYVSPASSSSGSSTRRSRRSATGSVTTAFAGRPLGRRPGAVHRSGAGRRARRLPHHPGLRAHAVTRWPTTRLPT